MEAKQNLKSNESLPVYEAEIIEDNNKDDIEKFASAKPVVNKTTIAQKIGKTIGAIAAIAGILSEIRQYLPYQYNKEGCQGLAESLQSYRYQPVQQGLQVISQNVADTLLLHSLRSTSPPERGADQPCPDTLILPQIYQAACLSS